MHTKNEQNRPRLAPWRPTQNFEGWGVSMWYFFFRKTPITRLQNFGFAYNFSRATFYAELNGRGLGSEKFLIFAIFYVSWRKKNFFIFFSFLFCGTLGNPAEMVDIPKWPSSNVVSEIVLCFLKKIFSSHLGGPKWKKPGLTKKNLGNFFSLESWKGNHSMQNRTLIKKLYRLFFRISSRFRDICQKLVFWGKKVKNGKIDINLRWCVWRGPNFAYNHYLGCWVRFHRRNVHCDTPFGSNWKTFAKLKKSEKMENRNFSTLMGPRELKVCL